MTLDSFPQIRYRSASCNECPSIKILLLIDTHLTANNYLLLSGKIVVLKIECKKKSVNFRNSIENFGARVQAHMLKAFAVLAKNTNSGPSTHTK